ncbi:MAG TPA: hypothetical protein ENI82_03585 [Bacteroidetes bacterium]|nr:hypothetical protein [Bacteroidota bacterium]
MNEETYNKLKFNSQKFNLTPPDRTWNRLEYKLDRLQFEKNRNWKNKVVYVSSVAAVFIIIISFISILKQGAEEIGVDNKSEFIVNKMDNTVNAEQQVYNVHTLNDYYSKMENNKYRNNFKSLKVNVNPKG